MKDKEPQQEQQETRTGEPGKAEGMGERPRKLEEVTENA